MTLETVYFLLPEIILILAGSLIYLGGAFLGPKAPWGGLALAALGFAALVLLEGRPGEITASAWRDPLGQYVRWLALGVGGLLVLTASGPRLGEHAAEIVGSLVLLIAGLMLTASAQDLVLLFSALELISIPTYVLLILGRRDPTAQETATKYFLLSVLSSAVLLYGFSFLYGLGGSTRLDLIAERLAAPELHSWRPLAIVALVLVFAGLAFRLAAVPFHFYAPDVYEGTTQLNAGVLSIVPKLAALIALTRLLIVGVPSLASYGWMLALGMSLATMTVGNLLALWQNNVRRLLAYSSIAHGGYVLIGITVAFASAGGAEVPLALGGVSAALFYLTVYAVATAGAFAALVLMGRGDGRQLDEVDELAGAGRTQPLAAAALAVAMFSLAGIPPLAGFWGKFTLLAGAVSLRSGAVAANLEPWLLALAIVAVLNAAVAAAYYLRLIAVMYFRPPAPLEHAPTSGGGAGLAAILATAAVIWLGVFPGPVMRATRHVVPTRPALQEAPRIDEPPIRADRPAARGPVEMASFDSAYPPFEGPAEPSPSAVSPAW